MKYEIQIQSVDEGYINLNMSLEDFRKLSWSEQYDLIERNANTSRVDMADWILNPIKEKNNETNKL